MNGVTGMASFGAQSAYDNWTAWRMKSSAFSTLDLPDALAPKIPARVPTSSTQPSSAADLALADAELARKENSCSSLIDRKFDTRKLSNMTTGPLGHPTAWKHAPRCSICKFPAKYATRRMTFPSNYPGLRDYGRS